MVDNDDFSNIHEINNSENNKQANGVQINTKLKN
jgi:hypothetical protein